LKGISPAQPATKKRIGDMLVDAGVITPAMLSEALDVQRTRGTKIVETLIHLGHVTVDEFVNFLSRQPGIASLDLRRYHISAEVVELIPRELAVKHEIFPIDRMGRLLTLAMACPLDSETINMIQEQTGLRVTPSLCAPGDIREAIDHDYPCDGSQPFGNRRVQSMIEKEVQSATMSKARTGLKLQNVADTIRQLTSLPALPSTVARVQESLGDVSISPKEVAVVIAQDPPVAAKVLSVANSPAYGFASQVNTIELAVALLGLRETYAAVLSAAVLNLFETNKRFDYRAFWEESMNTAAAARIIAQACGKGTEGGAFTAGLLHDIGRIALLETVPDLYANVPSNLYGDELIEAEQKIVGLSHTEAGYELAMHWNLPKAIAYPIRYHHQPDRAKECPRESTIVAVAEAWTRFPKTRDRKRGLDVPVAWLNIIGLDKDSAGVAYDMVAQLERARFAWNEEPEAAAAH
jgi:HD-like signal output (HDOD) protein